MDIQELSRRRSGLRSKFGPTLHAWRTGNGWVPPVGWARLGGLRRVRPVSRAFGFDRGQPVDRYYIERFLTRHIGDIGGRVLEIGEDRYTREFGGARVGISDVLHVNDGNPRATIVDDLAVGERIPTDTYDCVILTQTLHLIYDFHGAVRTLYRVLRPGGVALVTVPGISQVDRGEWQDTWYWSFTVASMQRVFGEVFGAGNVDAGSDGNVSASCAFLQGLASAELRPRELDAHDPSYPVVVRVRARRPLDEDGQ